MFQSLDTFQKEIKVLPFPAAAKVRISITGLALCQLNKNASRIYFLRHLEDTHALVMTVEGTERISGANAFGPRNFTIKKKARVLIELEAPAVPNSVRTTGDHPLEMMLNLQKIHGNPVDIIVPTKTSTVDIANCAFYTIKFFPSGTFDIIELGTPGIGMTRDIGFVMGGNMAATNPNSGLRITSDGAAITNLPLPLPGATSAGKEIVYEILINNHCTNDVECVKQAAAVGGTDFGFYYDVLDDRIKSGRKFVMKPRPKKAGKGKMRDLGADVSACNPVIIDPSEPYFP
jgi:hypothetical protein